MVRLYLKSRPAEVRREAGLEPQAMSVPHPLDTVTLADDQRRYVTLPWQVSVFNVDLLSINAHVADLAHWAYNHQARKPTEYVPMRNAGPHFESRIQPTAARPGHHGRARSDGLPVSDRPGHRPRPPHLHPDPRREPRHQQRHLQHLAHRIRKLGPDLPLWPLNGLLAALVWLAVRRNTRADRETLRWIRPLEKPLWVTSDSSSVRKFQRFYHRQTTNAPGNS
ncbi:hypothetical protein [Streptomyces aureoversilis]|uniref:Transposase n=1 Tax=Streptomyces aureoversilis TaxID=67277 RepID=A0ABW0A8J3_9ACTN